MRGLRLQRLLEKKKKAMQMPKCKLADYEEAYIELLCRIDAERLKLGLDTKSIVSFREKCRTCSDEAIKKHFNKNPEIKAIVVALERKLTKSALNGEIENVDFLKERLTVVWKTLQKEITNSKQIKMFNGD